MSKKINIFHREIEVKVLLEVLAIHILLALILTGAYVLEPIITGLVTGAEQFNYVDKVDIEFNESGEYIWNLENPGKLKAIRASGTVENEGSAKIYIENDGIKHLIFDSDKLNEKEILDKITGFVVAENKGKEPNRPPTWSSNGSVFIVNGTLTMDLDNYFNDKDNDVLTYAASELNTNDLEILLENSILTINNKNNIGSNRTLHLTASDNETSKKKGITLILIEKIMINETPIENITNQTINITPTNITNETIINKSININLEYKVRTNYDVDDNGIETTTGLVDLTVESSRFNWDVKEENLCTRWETYSVENEESTFVCYGNSDCCALVNLAPMRANWNEVFYSYYGLYGATLNNVISAQLIYADYELSIDEPYVEVVYSDWANLSAMYYTGLIAFDNICVETCTLFDFNETSYKLIVEVNNTKLNLNGIDYIIEKEVLINNEPILIKNISNITIIKNKNYTIDLSGYFFDGDNDTLLYDYYKDVENISVYIDNGLATIVPDVGFTGTRFMFFKANDSLLSAVSNVFKVEVIESGVSRVELGKPVKWVETISINKTNETIKVSIPITASNITLQASINNTIKTVSNEKIKIIDKGKEKSKGEFEKGKELEKVKRKINILKDAKNENAEKAIIEGKGIRKDGIDEKLQELKIEEGELKRELSSEIGLGLISGAVIAEVSEIALNETAIVINETVDEITLEYYTETPYAIEKEFGNNKQIKIISETSYENVLSFTDIVESNKDNIRLYWVKDTGKELFENVDYIDTNLNGLIDRIEWVIPHLSNQTFEVEITVLNVQSFPTVGGNWTVRFNATGTGNLTILAINSTTYSELNDDGSLTADDLVPLSLSCNSFEYFDKENLIENDDFYIILENNSKTKYSDT
ncbi:hypothetical protein CMO93_06190, partial [Candidatus Woesearchaeota archaeon]|nr:hypothetical protein [Candidatus Woesearchaeota archaeon]